MAAGASGIPTLQRDGISSSVDQGSSGTAKLQQPRQAGPGGWLVDGAGERMRAVGEDGGMQDTGTDDGGGA